MSSSKRKPRILAWSLEHDPEIEEKARKWAGDRAVIVAVDCEERLSLGRGKHSEVGYRAEHERWTLGIVAWIDSQRFDAILTPDGRISHPDAEKPASPELPNSIESMALDAGLRLISFESDLDSEFETEVASQIPRVSVAERLLAGRQNGAKAGLHQSGPAPYGYRRDYSLRGSGEPLLEIDPVEGEIVRLIFVEYLRKRSMKNLIEHLEAQGLRTRRGKRWSRAGVAWILKNETYIGVVHFGEVRSRGRHPAIISSIIFNKANALMKRNNRRGGEGCA